MNPAKDEIIAFTVDAEWAHDDVLADVLKIFDDHDIPITLFCTHDGIEPSGHERALHPNYRNNGDLMRRFFDEHGAVNADVPTMDQFRYVLQHTKEYAPEAIGVRSHCLLTESGLLPVYNELGLEYESGFMMPLTAGISPAMKFYDILELPIFLNDHAELRMQATGHELSELKPGAPGLKVFTFHPNIVYLNAPNEEHYEASRPHYRDPDALLSMRHSGRGTRTMLLELLDYTVKTHGRTRTLAELNSEWRGDM